MKIRELSIISLSDLKKLGKFAELSVEEYVEWINQQKKAGRNVNKFYQSLYDQICNGLPDITIPVKEEPVIKDAVQLELEAIPIDEIQYYVDNNDYSQHCGSIRRSGITNLGLLYASQFLSKHKYENIAQKWQSLLKEKSSTIISDWNDYHTIKVIPSEIDKEEGLIDNLKKAIVEIGSTLADRINNIYIQS